MGLLIYTFVLVLVMISIWSRAEHTSLIPRFHFYFGPVYFASCHWCFRVERFVVALWILLISSGYEYGLNHFINIVEGQGYKSTNAVMHRLRIRWPC
jgi:hypothetical protein